MGAIPKTALALKGHQSAMVQRCLEMEKNNTLPYGVINTPVGSGKTFVSLALPLLDKH
jgi:CRISPR/Cas system-associated endonuclease/helicase Cas3